VLLTGMDCAQPVPAARAPVALTRNKPYSRDVLAVRDGPDVTRVRLFGVSIRAWRPVVPVVLKVLVLPTGRSG
jgi:hypothetical protein